MQHLKFQDDKTFKLVQFTDLHFINDKVLDRESQKLMEKVLNDENPDLVVFTGDLIETNKCSDPEQAFRNALEPVNQSGVPWAAVYGNHDTETKVSKERLCSIQQEYAGCLTQKGNVSGLGNYDINILDSSGQNIAWTLYFLDSGINNQNQVVGGYDYIKRDQIDWYIKQSTKLNEEYSNMQSLMFFHIPIPEYQQVWDRKVCYGTRADEISSPEVNSGLFSALLEQGDVKGVFVGHDHLNDFFGNLYGIDLFYGRLSGYGGYGASDFTTGLFDRGARIIRMKENVDGFDTWIRMDDGSIIENQDKHLPLKTSENDDI